MQIEFFVDVNGERFAVKGKLCTAMEKVRTAVSTKTGQRLNLLVADGKLEHGGEIIQDEDTLLSSGLKDGDVIYASQLNELEQSISSESE